MLLDDDQTLDFFGEDQETQEETDKVEVDKEELEALRRLRDQQARDAEQIAQQRQQQEAPPPTQAPGQWNPTFLEMSQDPKRVIHSQIEEYQREKAQEQALEVEKQIAIRLAMRDNPDLVPQMNYIAPFVAEVSQELAGKGSPSDPETVLREGIKRYRAHVGKPASTGTRYAGMAPDVRGASLPAGNKKSVADRIASMDPLGTDFEKLDAQIARKLANGERVIL